MSMLPGSTDSFVVEEFYPKPDPPNWFQRNIIPPLRKLPSKLWPFNNSQDDDHFSSSDDGDDGDISYYRLPKIPKTWKPDSVSTVQKRWHIADQILNDGGTSGFPQVEELYFSPVEIEWRNQQKEAARLQRARAHAVRLMEKWAGMDWMYMTDMKRREAMLACNIDPVTATERSKPIQTPQMQPRDDLPHRRPNNASTTTMRSPVKSRNRSGAGDLVSDSAAPPMGSGPEDVTMTGALPVVDNSADGNLPGTPRTRRGPRSARDPSQRPAVGSHSPMQARTTRGSSTSASTPARRAPSELPLTGRLKRTASQRPPGSPTKKKRVTIQEEEEIEGDETPSEVSG